MFLEKPTSKDETTTLRLTDALRLVGVRPPWRLKLMRAVRWLTENGYEFTPHTKAWRFKLVNLEATRDKVLRTRII